MDRFEFEQALVEALSRTGLFRDERARRERIATAAMHGLLATGAAGYDSVADHAVEYADALIAKLDAAGKPS